MVALVAQCATAYVQCVEARCRGRERVCEPTGVCGNICIMVYIMREWTTDICQRICIYHTALYLLCVICLVIYNGITM